MLAGIYIIYIYIYIYVYIYIYIYIYRRTDSEKSLVAFYNILNSQTHLYEDKMQPFIVILPSSS